MVISKSEYGFTPSILSDLSLQYEVTFAALVYALILSIHAHLSIKKIHLKGRDGYF